MKKKTLAKRPNNLIKEICRREAGKSEVSIGNVRSVIKHLCEIMSEPNDQGRIYWEEFDTYFSTKMDAAFVRKDKARLRKALAKSKALKRKRGKV